MVLANLMVLEKDSTPSCESREVSSAGLNAISNRMDDGRRELILCRCVREHVHAQGDCFQIVAALSRPHGVTCFAWSSVSTVLTPSLSAQSPLSAAEQPIKPITERRRETLVFANQL